MYDYQEITIRLPDGYEAYARLWEPSRFRGAVLFLHGIQSHAGWYETSGHAMQQAGYAVLQPDRRGSGRNQRDRGHAASPQQLLDDGRCCLEFLLQRYSCPSAFLLGMSWGGKLAAAMHVDNSRNVAGLLLITPGLFPIVDVSAAEKFRIGWSMVSNPTKHYDIPLNDPELFTKTPKWMDYLRNDELQLHQATAGFFLVSRRMDKIFKRLGSAPAVPLHLMLAADEKIIDNEETIAFVRGINWPHRSITFYERSRHTLEFDPDRDAFLHDLVRWLNNPTAYDGMSGTICEPIPECGTGS